MFTPQTKTKPCVKPLNRGTIKAEKSPTSYPKTHGGFEDDDNDCQPKQRTEIGHEYHSTVFPLHPRHESPHYRQELYDPCRTRMFE